MAELVGNMFANHVSPNFDGFEEVKISMLSRHQDEDDEQDSSNSSPSIHSRSASISSASSISSFGPFTQGHKRQTSHPPPFQTYHDEEGSPVNDVRNPYSLNSFIPPNYTVLPAFGSPRLYSARLHRLMESRDRPLFLYLDKEEPDFIEKQNLQDVYLDGKSTYDDSDAGLLPQLPCDEESLCYEKPRRATRRRFSSCVDADKEISWVTFAGIAAVLFIIVCSCSFLVAWMAGLFAEGGGLMSHMHIGSKVAAAVPASLNEASWTDDYRAALDAALRKEGHMAGGDMTAEELATFQQLQTVAGWPEKRVRRTHIKKRGTMN